jgi:hypothetical protein
MPIIKDENLLFIHIPKTGGSSITDFFSKNGMEVNLWSKGNHIHPDIPPISSKWDRNNITFSAQHWIPKYIKEYIKDYDYYFKFTFVRNPYTRILSEYFFNPHVNFKGIKYLNEWIPLFLKNIDHCHKLPQSDYVDNTVNYIGKYENLQNHFSNLLTMLGINLNPGLPRLNPSSNNKEELITLITRENLNLINSIYQKDFIDFNYKIV